MIVTLDTNYLKTCVMNIILMCCDSCARVDIQYTYFHESLGRYSVIDHIFVDRSFPRGGGFFTGKYSGECPEKIFPGEISGRELFWEIFMGINFSRDNRDIRGIVQVGVRISVRDYKCLRVAVMIWATLVNTQTHTQTHKRISTSYIPSGQRHQLGLRGNT